MKITDIDNNQLSEGLGQRPNSSLPEGRKRAQLPPFLHIEDSLLSKENEQLPFGRHVICFFQHFHFVENLIIGMFMGTKEVEVSDPESQVIVGTLDVVKAVCVTVRSFISTVQPLDHLFERLRRYALGLTWYATLTGNDVMDNSFTELMELAAEDEMQIARECVSDIVLGYNK